VPSLAIELPGHGASDQPFSDLHGDAAAVARLIERLATPVTLVGHSYGGAVISQAAAGLSAVTHLVYLAAYVPDIGESVTGMSLAMPKVEIPLSKAMAVDGDGLVIDAMKAGPIFYGHCAAHAVAASAARLCRQPFATFQQPASAAAWRTISSTYVRCTDDQAVHITHQDLMAARCTHIESLDTDHSPFLSLPAATADILVGV
jgi:pimeloyl-ACP methyl ester carboxylesterase